MSKEGLPTLIGLFLFAILLAITGYLYHHTALIVLFWIDVVLFFFPIYFFRDPARIAPHDSHVIVSPTDGRVIDVSQVEESIFVEKIVTRISIYMSLTNVHINYVPFMGQVEYITYHRGAYHRASTSEAHHKNASSFIGIETKYGKYAFRQVTGMLTRRIVNYLRLGHIVKTGQKFGMIKFGSRIEVYLPSWATINVHVGDHLRACESVIATVNEK